MGKISVVIPVMNEEEKIGQCLEAVLSQSLKPHEVIVVDGHSTDQTVERAKNVGRRVRVFGRVPWQGRLCTQFCNTNF